jgi:RND family efflux transporter MFP subunit
MKKSLIIGLIALLIIVALIINKIIIKGNQEKTKTTITLVSVLTEKATTGNITGMINYTGTVQGINESDIISQTSGIAIKVNMTVGKKCSEGTILAEVENSLQNAAVEQAKAQVLAAEQDHEKSKIDLQRNERLNKDNVVTKDQLELSQLKVKASLSQLKSAQAGLKVAEKQLADTYIKSTINGVVSTKEIDKGATVAPGTKIARIVDVSKFKIKIMVSENDAVKLQPGKTVTVKIDAIPNKSFTGKINSIGLNSEPGLRSYPVEVLIDNNGNSDIRSGMFARCEILAESKENTMIIPDKAVIMNNDGSTQVYVLENGKAYLKTVKLGVNHAGKYEVLSGITIDSKIITDGKERLTNGIEVKEK